MRYRKDGNWHELVRITGPSHNLLALQVTTAKVRAPQVQIVGNISSMPRMARADVIRQVQDGVARANNVYGMALSVQALRYAADDTPGDSVYQFLAQEIVKRIAATSSGTQRLAAG